MIFGSHRTVLRRLRIILSVVIDNENLQLSTDTTVCYFWHELGLISAPIFCPGPPSFPVMYIRLV